jgi:hypothetical protein
MTIYVGTYHVSGTLVFIVYFLWDYVYNCEYR